MAVVQPVIRLIVSAGVFQNPYRLAAPGFKFILQNDLIRNWEISKDGGGVVFRRRANDKRPLWDQNLFTYLNEPVDDFATDEQINAHSAGTPIPMCMSMSVTFKEFSKILMTYLTREKDDEF